jgi:hypothetical protein
MHQLKGAMTKVRKIEIIIETARRVEIHVSGAGRTRCQQCDAEVAGVTPQTAPLPANSLGVDRVDGAAPSNLHRPASSDRVPRTCLESFSQLASKGNQCQGTGLVEGLPPEK